MSPLAIAVIVLLATLATVFALMFILARRKKDEELTQEGETGTKDTTVPEEMTEDEEK